MRIFNIIAVVFLTFMGHSMKGQEAKTNNYYGAEFEIQPKIEAKSSVYAQLGAKDTVQTQFAGTIEEVCQAKGCWMKVRLASNEQVFVRFKDYGFFVPKDAAGKTVVMNGMAFVEEMSVQDQKHYAIDRGDSQEEVAKIKEPKSMPRFEADGVMIED